MKRIGVLLCCCCIVCAATIQSGAAPEKFVLFFSSHSAFASDLTIIEALAEHGCVQLKQAENNTEPIIGVMIATTQDRQDRFERHSLFAEYGNCVRIVHVNVSDGRKNHHKQWKGKMSNNGNDVARWIHAQRFNGRSLDSMYEMVARVVVDHRDSIAAVFGSWARLGSLVACSVAHRMQLPCVGVTLWFPGSVGRRRSSCFDFPLARGFAHWTLVGACNRDGAAAIDFLADGHVSWRDALANPWLTFDMIKAWRHSVDRLARVLPASRFDERSIDSARHASLPSRLYLTDFRSAEPCELGADDMAQRTSLRSVGLLANPSPRVAKRLQPHRSAEMAADARQWIDADRMHRPVVLVAFGQSLALYSQAHVIEALELLFEAQRASNETFRMLVATGSPLRRQLSLPSPTMARVQDWFDQPALLGHRLVRVFVTHCGIKSAHNALRARVPMIGLPLLLEQHYNAARLRALGVARAFHTIAATNKALRSWRDAFDMPLASAANLRDAIYALLARDADIAERFADIAARHAHFGAAGDNIAADLLPPLRAHTAAMRGGKRRWLCFVPHGHYGHVKGIVELAASYQAAHGDEHLVSVAAFEPWRSVVAGAGLAFTSLGPVDAALDAAMKRGGARASLTNATIGAALRAFSLHRPALLVIDTFAPGIHLAARHLDIPYVVHVHHPMATLRRWSAGAWPWQRGSGGGGLRRHPFAPLSFGNVLATATDTSVRYSRLGVVARDDAPSSLLEWLRRAFAVVWFDSRGGFKRGLSSRLSALVERYGDMSFGWLALYDAFDWIASPSKLWAELTRPRNFDAVEREWGARLGLSASDFDDAPPPLTICTSWPQIERAPLAEPLPEWLHVTGPAAPRSLAPLDIVADTRVLLDDVFPQHARIVVVSSGSGTNGNWPSAQRIELRAALEAVAIERGDIRMVWAGANDDETCPLNALCVPWLDQLQMLADRRTAVLVSHCGFNSVLESLSSGVPLLCIPIMSDQFNWARGIREAGAGLSALHELSGAPKRIGRQELREWLIALLDDSDGSFSRNASALYAASQRQGGAQLAVDIIYREQLRRDQLDLDSLRVQRKR
jgi:UDP:flavonoid glycosyltransferase YjiC (YdhE family)